MNDKARISDMTIEELRSLIRETVQEAVAEVMVEFSVAAEFEAALVYKAEMNDMLRGVIHEHFGTARRETDD